MERAHASDHASAAVTRRARDGEMAKARGYYKVTCRDKHGRVKWVDEIHNLIVNEGMDHILESAFNGTAFTAADFIGLTDSTPTPAAGDTMASHPGWTEVTAYSEATRVAYDPAAASGQQITNAASVATFNINANSTVLGGLFLSTDSTKGGATGTLISVGAFQAGDKSLDSGDSIDCTLQISLS